LEATKLLSRIEGIIPALETAHAIAGIEKVIEGTNRDNIIVLNLSGRGDKDLNTIMKNFDTE
jgi:tryptophan synthase beta chain